MPTTTNAMAGAGVQPKFMHQGTWSIVCTQAIASNAASGQQYLLFNVGSGATIMDCYLRLSAALSTAASQFHLGTASNDSSLIASCGMTTVTVARATKGLPMTVTADTPIYLCIDAGAATAAGNVFVGMLCAQDIA